MAVWNARAGQGAGRTKTPKMKCPNCGKKGIGQVRLFKTPLLRFGSQCQYCITFYSEREINLFVAALEPAPMRERLCRPVSVGQAGELLAQT